ncbi:hypothetical protein EWI61_10810 [Methylolobus aquaticus]|nr:hypothetical protein EWI61_10810 [Methylolobus aquaticus]
MTQPREPESSRRWRFGAEAANNIVQTAAIVAAGAWAVYTFIYQAKIAPSQEPPSLSVTSTLAEVGHKGDQVAIRSTVTRTNVGHTGVRLLALTYNLIGSKVAFADKIWPGPEPELELSRSNRITSARYYSAPEQEVILRHGILFKGAAQLDDGQAVGESVLFPGESISRDMIFYADREKFDFVHFQVQLTYAKESDPPVPLSFRLGEQQQIEAVPVTPCRPDGAECTPIVTTDFATDLSLW